jgi:hypothetical protein
MEWKGDALHARNNATDGLFGGERKGDAFPARNKRQVVREAGKASRFARQYYSE